MDKINRYIDAAVLKPETTREEAIEAIQNCIDYKTKTVCVRPCDIELAIKMCKDTETQVSCVLSFPHGTTTSHVKAYEASEYIKLGVNEIDMVVNYSFILSGEWNLVKQDIELVSDVTKKDGILLKVILETCYLTQEDIAKTVEIAIEAGVDYVKTSTGFGTHGATKEAVNTMVETANGRIKVKASGGIRTQEDAINYVKMGCTRLGSGYKSNKAIIDGNGKATGVY